MNLRQTGLTVLTLGVAALLGACAADQSPTAANGPQLDVTDNGPSYGVYVCKDGPAGTYTFNISATGDAGGTFPGWFYPNGQSVNITVIDPNAPEATYCQRVWGPGADPATSNVQLTVAEVVPTGMKVDSIVWLTTTQPGVRQTFTGISTITIPASYIQGSYLKFSNSPKPPEICTDNTASNYGGPLPCVYPPKYCTVTPGGWTAPPSGNNFGMQLKNRFPTLYPSGVTVGTTGVSNRFYTRFTSSAAVDAFALGGTPGPLTANHVNPTAKTEAGELLGQVLALRLNVDFSNAGFLKPGLPVATLTSGALAGLTVTQVLGLANQALGGNTSVLGPYGITVANLTTILGSVNGANDGCTVNTGYLN